MSSKINSTSAKNDALRQHQRRYKALWTIYTSFAYLLAALILTLVTGYKNWNAAEYTGIASAPLMYACLDSIARTPTHQSNSIYGVRAAIDAYYNYRIANTQGHLNDLNQQRDAAIEKLKAATKYNSTQQLLDKYGASPPRPSPVAQSGRKSGSKTSTPQAARTGLPPPPTANIPRQPTFPTTPQGAQSLSNGRATFTSSLRPNNEASPTEEFAPNAFSASPPSRSFASTVTDHSGPPRWYDRILDLVLGDDETQPKNRIVLICAACRLVNGQAPPGTRSLNDVGKWRCSECGAMNGVESEARQMIRDIARPEGQAVKGVSHEDEMSEVRGPRSPSVGVQDDGEEPDEGDDSSDAGDAQALADASPAGSTRSKARQRKKG